MPHMRDVTVSPYKRILALGKTGSGKSTQMWTLKGKKFLYNLDPNTMSSLKGIADQLGIDPPDIEYESFEPEFLELDATLKAFRKDAKDDTSKSFSKREPTVYNDFVEDLNSRVEDGFFKDYNWLMFDGLTFIVRATMNRQLYINDHYGGIEDKADYRIVGSKITEIFSALAALPINIYMTGHIAMFEDEKSKRIVTQIHAPGNSRNMLPLVFTDIWQTSKDDQGYVVRTRPDPRGLQDIRCSIQGLEELEDVTIGDFAKAEQFGIGAILAEHSKEK